MDNTSKPVRLPDIAAAIYDLLDPLDTSQRQKALQGALAMLGDPVPPEPATGGAMAGVAALPPAYSAAHSRVKGPRAQAWLKKHGISEEQVERVFHLDGAGELIVQPPGESMREQAVNAYVLLGAQRLLQNDDPKFTDSEVIVLCKKMGCHDKANHALTRTKLGNRVSGSKDTGYALTVPGQDHAAALIKILTPAT